MTAPEQRHIQSAFAFELSKVETPAIRSRMLGHLALVEESLAQAVETAIGMEGERAEITPYKAPVDLDPSPALSLVGKAKPTLKGRKIGALVTDGADGDRSRLCATRWKRKARSSRSSRQRLGCWSQIGKRPGRRHGAVGRAFGFL